MYFVPAISKLLLRLGIVILLSCRPDFSGLAVEPLIRAHAHNDYEHVHPLQDALADGFCSVEADIYLVDGQLLVAHERSQIRPDRTLQNLYLDPLQRKIGARGYVFARDDGFTLLIDIKTDSEKTYQVLEPVLKRYGTMLARFTDTNLTRGAVTVVLTGSRPIKAVRVEAERFCAIDGRLPDLEENPSRFLMPWISDDWAGVFHWNGQGEMPAAERAHLRELVARAHAQGRRLRFWDAPDNPRAWRELFSAGVDLINTDRLDDLRDFLLAQKNSPPPNKN